MGYITSEVVKSGGLPMHLVEPLIHKLGVDYFIESGTAGGSTIRQVAPLFKKLWTIELIEGRANIDESLTNIKWLTGNSAAILPNIISELLSTKQKEKPQYAIFFLDAHYSDPTPNTSEYKECYLLEELYALEKYKDDAIVIIDDARLFIGPTPWPCDPREWPTIQQIFDVLNKNFENNIHTLRDDYIISYPDRIKDIFDEEWSKNFSLRYPSDEHKLKSAGKLVWKSVFKYLND